MEQALAKLLHTLRDDETLSKKCDTAHAHIGSNAAFAAALLLSSSGILTSHERVGAIAVATCTGVTPWRVCLYSLRERCLAAAVSTADATMLAACPSAVTAGEYDEVLFASYARTHGNHYPAAAPASSSCTASKTDMYIVPGAVHAPFGGALEHEDARTDAIQALRDPLLPQVQLPVPQATQQQPLWPTLALAHRPMQAQTRPHQAELEERMVSLARASSQQLLPQEASSLLTALHAVPQLVEGSGLRAGAVLQPMVDLNAEVAAEAVRAACKCSNRCKVDWTNALQAATPSVRVMEAAGRLLHDANIDRKALVSLTLTCVQVLAHRSEREARLATELARAAVYTGCICESNELAELQACSLELAHTPEGASLYSFITSKLCNNTATSLSC